MVSAPAASASTGNLLEMHILRPHLDLPEQKLRSWGPLEYLNAHFRAFLSTTSLDIESSPLSFLQTNDHVLLVLPFRYFPYMFIHLQPEPRCPFLSG